MAKGGRRKGGNTKGKANDGFEKGGDGAGVGERHGRGA